MTAGQTRRARRTQREKVCAARKVSHTKPCAREQGDATSTPQLGKGVIAFGQCSKRKGQCAEFDRSGAARGGRTATDARHPLASVHRVGELVPSIPSRARILFLLAGFKGVMDYAWVPDNGLEQPVPALQPTPALTAYDIVFEGSFFLAKTQMLYFYRGREPLIIMIARKSPPEDHFLEWYRFEIAQELAEQQQALEICQTLLHLLPFGKTSSAYLVQGAGGAWRCVSGQKHMGLSFPAQRSIAIADVADVRLTRLAAPAVDRHEGFW
jgi:hypothetical protein